MRAAIVLLVLSSGCATALSTTQPAETLHAGEIHVGVSTDVSIPASRIVDAVDAADDVGRKYVNDPDYVPTEAEKRQLFDAAVGLAVAGIGPLTDFHARYGILDWLDAGVRYTGVGLHLETKLQFLGDRDGWQGSFTAGYVHHLFKGLVFDVLDFVAVDDFARSDVQLGALFGTRLGGFGHFWVGPKYVFGHVSLDTTLQNVDETLSVSENLHYLGAVTGLAVGYKAVFVFAELTAMNLWASPTILGQETDIGGLVLMPSFGLMARF